MNYKGSVLHIKRGETFSFSGAVTNAADQTPVDTAKLTATSQIRHDAATRDLIADLSCVWLDDSVLRVYYDGDTSTWPVAQAVWDILLTDDQGQVRSTQTVLVQIEKFVTKASKVD